MICREYLDNFFSFFLYNNLLSIKCQLSIVIVNYISLIMRSYISLSTISFFGANLISLYLFSAKNRGNLLFFRRISLWISIPETLDCCFCELLIIFSTYFST